MVVKICSLPERYDNKLAFVRKNDFCQDDEPLFFRNRALTRQGKGEREKFYDGFGLFKSLSENEKRKQRRGKSDADMYLYDI